MQLEAGSGANGEQFTVEEAPQLTEDI